jgi:hypothetical protein
MLIELQLTGHAGRMDRARILREALELKFKLKKPGDTTILLAK